MNTPNESHNRQGSALHQILADDERRGFLARHKRWIGIALVVAAAVAWVALRSGKEEAAPRYRTEAATVGELVVRVSATGNLQPTNQVEVGSELSGIVEQVLVDDNDRVKKGQVLARLDVSKLSDAVEKSRASLAAAEAQVLQAQATVAEAKAALARFQRVAELSGGKVPSQSEMDAADANLKRAEANAASANASVVQARANLRSDETNLYKATIRSPIDGVVLTRKVEPGQTVAASFQAPVLFTIAEDLRKMELQVDVDEADVGQVKVGQSATFTVDAWPGRKFAAVIQRVSFGSEESEGVVSYPTVLEVSNDDLSLRPGMTGTAEITTLTHDNALLVPNAALRFSPQASAGTAQAPRRGLTGMLMPRPPRTARKVKTAPDDSAPRVWVLRDGQPVPIEVKTGATNGKVTEILGGSLADGTEVITESIGSAT